LSDIARSPTPAPGKPGGSRGPRASPCARQAPPLPCEPRPRISQAFPGPFPHLPPAGPGASTRARENEMSDNRRARQGQVSRRAALAAGAAGLGWAALAATGAGARAPERKDAPVARKDPLRVTKLETFLVKPRWLFLK